jgi:signal transduction histidine kinase
MPSTPRSPLSVILIALGTWLFAAGLPALLLVQMPGRAIEQLAISLSGTGVMTLLTAYVFYRIGILAWFGSVRWALLLTGVSTSVQILLNVWLLAQTMFVDRQYLDVTGVILIYAGLTSLSLGFFVSRGITERVQQIGGAAQQVAAGDLAARLDVNGNDEIAQLAAAFNTMAGALQQAQADQQKLEKNRRDLIAWVSHDLRTPLAALRAMIEALADGVVRDEEDVFRYFDQSMSEIRHLSQLIDDLFDLSQMDVGHIPLRMHPTDLNSLIQETVGNLTASASSKNITLQTRVPDAERDPITIDSDKVQRVLYNLVGNAIIYSPKGSSVTVQAERQPNGVGVEVINTGVTIAPDMLEHVFDRFYRGDMARPQVEGKPRGAGLGLAIAKGFVEAHGGTIGASSDNGETRFFFTLPQGG